MTLAVDEARKREEVDQITGDDLFGELLEQSRQLRRASARSSGSHSADSARHLIDEDPNNE
jgi:hypothetical protein